MCGCSGNTHVVDIYDENYDVEEDFVAGMCELYRGLVCYKYVGGRLVFVRSDEDQRDMEIRLEGESSPIHTVVLSVLTIEMSKNLIRSENLKAK